MSSELVFVAPPSIDVSADNLKKIRTDKSKSKKTTGKFQFTYSNMNPSVVINTKFSSDSSDPYIQFILEQNQSAVSLDGTNYNIKKMILLPKIHTFDSGMDHSAEIIFIHTSDNGSELYVHVPIVTTADGGGSEWESFSEVVKGVPKNALTTQLLSGVKSKSIDFNPGTIIPRQPYLFYTSTIGGSNRHTIVFPPINGSYISFPNISNMLNDTTLARKDIFDKITSSVTYKDTPQEFSTSLDDDIYIKCNPVGHSDKTEYVKQSTGDSTDFAIDGSTGGSTISGKSVGDFIVKLLIGIVLLLAVFLMWYVVDFALIQPAEGWKTWKRR